jgi:hypothetical protein
MTMAHQRFHAPSRNGEILAVPSFEIIPELIEENRGKLDRANVVVDGIPLRDFRAAARREVMAQFEGARTIHCEIGSAPLILAGHQPELSHPGVWVKHFVLNGLARKVGGIPLNLVVDNDTLKSTSLSFPVFEGGKPETVRIEHLSFDKFAGEMPFEDRRVFDAGLFRSFPERGARLWKNWGFEPLLGQVWREDRTIGEAFVSARRSCELAWGCQNYELTVSRMSQTEAFRRFAKHILNDLRRFREVYNAAIQSYRRAYHIRSQNHPAPVLGQDEAPFWVRKGQDKQRERATPTSDINALRPRALTLTLFARLCVGDFFIHGIGGGKYDEVTDQIIRNFFDVDPPAYQVLSATLHLPLPSFPATEASLRKAQRLVRDLLWNPQVHLLSEQVAQPTAKRLLAQKDKLIRSEPDSGDHQVRREWFRALQQVTSQLRQFVADRIPTVEKVEREIRLELEANEILQRRDYAWVLYPEATLKPFLQQFLHLADKSP